MAKKQVTIKVVGFVTVTVEETAKVENMPMKIDVYTHDEDESSEVLEVNETDITEKEVVTTVGIGNICQCGCSLEVKKSVVREYINKDGGESRFALGHYTKGDFEPDETIDLSTGRYDLVDGSDKCADCDKVVG